MSYRLFIVYVIAFLGVFRVHPSFGGPFTAVFLHDILLVILLPLVALSIKVNMHHLLGARMILALASVSVLAFGFTVSDSPSGHAMYAVRIAYLLYVYIFIYSICVKNNMSLFDFGKAINVIIIFNSIVVAIQVFEPPIAYDIVTVIFGDDKLKGFDFVSPRAFGVFFNVNWAGVIYSMFIIVILAQFKYGYIDGYRITLLTSLLMFCLVMTGSRTGLLIFISVSILWLLIHGHLITAIGMTIIPVVVITVGYLSGYVNLGRFSDIVDVILSGEGLFVIDTMARRTETMQLGIDLFFERPIFGWGDVGHVFHNSWITTLVNLGVVGSLMLISILCSIVLFKIKTIRKRAIITCISLPLLISSFTGEYIYVTQVMVTYIILVASIQCTKKLDMDKCNNVKVLSKRNVM